jgi:hypothetical protein
MTNNVIWRPNAGPQEALVTSPIPEIFFGGARGGGKTDGLLGDFAAHAGQYGQHARGIIFRRTLPEFKEIERRSVELYTQLGAVFRKSEREWTFPNGATLLLRYLYDASDAANYQGHSFTWVGVDEAGSWVSPDAIDMMRATMRSAHGVPVYMRLTGNPGGLGHLWLKERYIDPAPPFTPHYYAPQPEERPDLLVEAAFIPSKLEDNPYLLHDPTYENRLAAAGGPALFRAWRYGDWNAIIGAAFGEWRTEVHVSKMDKVPAGWRIVGGMDWGFGAPGAFYLVAWSPNDQAYVFLEHYYNQAKNTPGTPAYDVGYEIGTKMMEYRTLGIMEQYPEYISLDQSAFSTKDGRGGRWQSIADMIQLGLNAAMGEDKIPIIAAPAGKGSRHSGKAVLHQLLSFDVAEDGTIPDHLAPKIRFHPRCVHLIRTIPALPVDEHDKEDVDTDAEDHAYDALRYAIAARNPETLRTAKRTGTFNQHPGLTSSGQRAPQPWEEQYQPNIQIISRWHKIQPGDRRDEDVRV